MTKTKAMTQPDQFACKHCGKESLCAPDDGSGATCPECCEEHDYIYDRGDQEHFCKTCGDRPSAEWQAEWHAERLDPYY